MPVTIVAITHDFVEDQKGSTSSVSFGCPAKSKPKSVCSGSILSCDTKLKSRERNSSSSSSSSSSGRIIFTREYRPMLHLKHSTSEVKRSQSPTSKGKRADSPCPWQFHARARTRTRTFRSSNPGMGFATLNFFPPKRPFDQQPDNRQDERTRKAPEASVSAVSLAARQAQRQLCAQGLRRSAQAARLHAAHCFHP